MGWALTNTVSSGHRYRFVVQQPTTVGGAWGDVQSALQTDWGFGYVGNDVTLQQVGSSNLWVGEAIPNSGVGWTPATVAAQSQSVKNGFTYLAIAVQARDDLTRLVHKGSTYSFDVRVPSAWTVSQVMTYLQGKGWNVASVVPTSDAVSLLAGRVNSIAKTIAFAITGTWNGADKTSIADSDGTISYGIFSSQAPVSIAGTTPAVGAASSSNATPWLIALGLVGVAGLGLFAFTRSKAKQNPSSPIYFDDLPLEERQRHAQLWRASIAKLRELSYPFQATFDGERVTVLGRVRDFEPYTSHPCQQAEATDESMMVRGSDGNKFIVFGHSLFVGDQRLVYQSGYRRRPVVDPLGLGWKENPIGVFIYDLDALDKLAELEGAHWLEDDRRMWQQYRSGNTAHAFQFAWWHTHKPGVLEPQDLPYWKEYFAGDMGIELGVIYGDGGYARFAVTDEGEIVLEGNTTRAEKIERAAQLGFRVVR